MRTVDVKLTGSQASRLCTMFTYIKCSHLPASLIYPILQVIGHYTGDKSGRRKTQCSSMFYENLKHGRSSSRRHGAQPVTTGCAMASMSSSSPHRDGSNLYLSWSELKSVQQCVLILQWNMFGFCAQNKISQQFVGKTAGTHSLRPLPHMEVFLGTRG